LSLELAVLFTHGERSVALAPELPGHFLIAFFLGVIRFFFCPGVLESVESSLQARPDAQRILD